MAQATAQQRNRSTPIIREVPGAVLSQPTPAAPFIVNIPLFTWAQLLVYFTIAGVAATRAQMAAQVASVRVVLSGREIWIGTGAQLLSLAAFYAQTDSAANYPGFLPINFLRSWSADKVDGEAAILGTKDQSNLQIEITMSAGATINGATLYGARLQEPEETGITTRVVRVSPNIGSVGLSVYPDLPAPRDGDQLLAIHVFPPVVANLTRLGYVRDEVRIIDDLPAVLDRIAVDSGQPRTPQGANGMVSIDFTALTGNPGDGVDMSRVGSHQLELTFANAAPGTFAILLEYASPISRGIQ